MVGPERIDHGDPPDGGFRGRPASTPSGHQHARSDEPISYHFSPTRPLTRLRFRFGLVLSLILGLIILTFPTPVRADVRFTTPAPGASLPGGGAVEIKWQESGKAPLIKGLVNYQLTLCAGGNAEGSYIELLTLVPSGSFQTGNIAQGVVPATIGGPTKNAYFFKMISTLPGVGTVTNFSKRFSFTGMTGNFPPDVTAAIKALGPAVVAGPADINKAKPDGVKQNPAADPNVDLQIGTALFAVPFAKQTGQTRYAPMMMIPPTKINKKHKPTPAHPTSKVNVAKARLKPARGIQTTVTQSRTYTMATRENPVQAAPGPNADDDEWRRYLSRWKD